MTNAEVLTRAQAALSVPVEYRLGQPGRIFPKGADDVPVPPVCDCSGFALWCIGMERSLPDAVMRRMQWFDTTAIWHDAKVRHKWFETCDPAPGCLIVYPDWKGKQGHVGIVSEVADGQVTAVIHCSAGNGRRGSAVQETGPEVFEKNGAITVRRKA